MKKLDADTIRKIEAAVEALREAAEAAQDYFDSKSEKWQESDAGTGYAAWIEALVNMADDLDALDHAPGA